MKLLKRIFKRPKDFSSAAYWSNRYKGGATSGAGSYGRLATYKADIINALVRERDIASVIEFGCGDGNQASLFDFDHYTGVDVVEQVVAANRSRFSDRTDWAFLTNDAFSQSPLSGEMTMSLDVIYHLVEDQVFDTYMTQLFDSAGRFVLIYASDHDERLDNPHVRHRNYSRWIAESRPDFAMVQEWEHPFPYSADSDPNETSFAFFRLYERQS